MIKEYFHIAHLISRHLSGEVTPEESRFLDKWRKESKSHEQLFQKICSDEHYAQHEIRKMEFDSQAGWKGVETRIKRMELRRRHLKLLRYVALFIAPVLILVFAFQDISVPHVMDGNQLLAAQQILPGGAKAILTLDNGETVYLDENADGRQLQLAGKQIQIDSTTLNLPYTAFFPPCPRSLPSDWRNRQSHSGAYVSHGSYWQGRHSSDGRRFLPSPWLQSA